MKTITILGLALLAGASMALAADPPKAEGFKAYQYMRLRSIFDPSRQRDPITESAPQPTFASEPGKVPFFALTGTLLRPEKVLGFFAGSSSEMNRVLGPGESIAGYQIRTVTLTGAELEKDGQMVPLPVGRQIPLSGHGAGTPQPYFPPAFVPSHSSMPMPPPSSDSRDYRDSRSSRDSRRDKDHDRDKDKDRDRDNDRNRDSRGPSGPGAMPPPPSSSSSSSTSSKPSEEVLRKMMERAQRERERNK